MFQAGFLKVTFKAPKGMMVDKRGNLIDNWFLFYE